MIKEIIPTSPGSCIDIVLGALALGIYFRKTFALESLNLIYEVEFDHGPNQKWAESRKQAAPLPKSALFAFYVFSIDGLCLFMSLDLYFFRCENKFKTCL